MYFNKPTDLVLSNWINEAFDIGKYRLKEAGYFQPNKYISIKRYIGGPYVAQKINYDVSGYGFGAIVEGFLEVEYVNEQIPCSSCSGGQATCSRCGGSGRVNSYC